MRRYLPASLVLAAACSSGAAQGPTGPVDPVEADLISLREEEKLARDVYLTLLDRWDLRAFENISASEQRHMDHVADLLRARSIPDPVTSDEVGDFSSPRFASLYAELTARGARSERDALEVGALIEDLDIADIDAMLARTNDPEVRQAYELLRCGSRNHLRAFTRLLADRGIEYEPAHVDADTYAAILAHGHERCGRIYSGRGRGRGWGRGRRGR